MSYCATPGINWARVHFGRWTARGFMNARPAIVYLICCDLIEGDYFILLLSLVEFRSYNVSQGH